MVSVYATMPVFLNRNILEINMQEETWYIYTLYVYMHENIWNIYTHYLEIWYGHLYFLLNTVTHHWLPVYLSIHVFTRNSGKYLHECRNLVYLYKICIYMNSNTSNICKLNKRYLVWPGILIPKFYITSIGGFVCRNSSFCCIEIQ